MIWIFILTPLFTFLLDQRGYETPDDFADIVPPTVDYILYGKEDPVGNASAYERVISYNLLDSEEDELEEPPEGAQKEAERLAN